jgi:predicted permease
MVLDIQLSLGELDYANASTLPNMDPHIRYGLIPMIGLGITGAAFLIELLLFRVLRPRTATRAGWLLLGLSYSLAIVDLLLRHFVGRGELPSVIAIVLVAVCFSSVHYWLFDAAARDNSPDLSRRGHS